MQSVATIDSLHYAKSRDSFESTSKLVPEPFLNEILDEMASGVILVDKDARILHSNRAGKYILSKGFFMLREGCLQTFNPDCDIALLDAITKAHDGKRSMVRLDLSAEEAASRRSSMNQETSMIVAVVPVGGNFFDTQRRCALIFSRPGLCEKLMLNFFAQANHLTPREEQIVGLLCQGLTAPKIAQTHQLQESTVRTHMRNILHKTNTNSVRELIKQLAMLPPMMTSVAG